MLFIKALTPLHVGTGRGEAIHVDLPIQRDEFGFPTIWSSSLKGALRAHYKDRDKGDKDGCRRRVIFGPEPASREVSEQSSAASFLDSRLLFIPARTLTNVWTYVTSSHMLERLNTYISLMNKPATEIQDPGDKVLTSRSDLIVNGNVILNEVELKAEHKAGIVEKLKEVLPKDIISSIEKKGLALIPDSISKTIVNKSLLIQHRVRLKEETKTVESGALWSEEYLPAESIMISMIICKNPGKNKSKCYDEELNGEKICKYLKEAYDGQALPIGGRETIGKGLVRIYIVP